MIAFALLLAAAAPAVPPAVDYGIEEGRCRPHESGPAVIATAQGLKDRIGLLRLELYAANDAEFLADDRDLVRDGKVFRRTTIAVPPSGTAELCIRAPHAGTWALALIHDRAGSKKFKLSSDGIGFSGNPHLGLSKPKAEAAAIAVGPGVTHIAIRLNYRRGLLSFGPLDEGR